MGMAFPSIPRSLYVDSGGGFRLAYVPRSSILLAVVALELRHLSLGWTKENGFLSLPLLEARPTIYI